MKIRRAQTALASLFAMLCFATIPCSAHALDAASAGAAVADAAATASYRLDIRLDPATRELAAEAQISVSDGAPFELTLNPRFAVESVAVNGKPVPVRLQRDGPWNRYPDSRADNSRSSIAAGSRRVRVPAASGRLCSSSARGSVSGTSRPSRISHSSTPPSRPPYVV